MESEDRIHQHGESGKSLRAEVAELKKVVTTGMDILHEAVQAEGGARGEAREQPSDAEIGKGGIEYAAARAAMLDEPDREIAAIILNHRGKRNAVSIEDVCKMLWPDEWAGKKFWPHQPGAEEMRRARNQLMRTVKASVERMRTQATIPVAACKGNPAGYYIPVTAEECDECYDRLLGEGIKLIRLAQLFKPDANLVKEPR